jgi:endonuclease/exonuclease/phosphatase family metal-dependent hydrolase
VDISVATFNIYNHEDFDQRLPAIIAVLEDAAADIVCLQEVPPRRGLPASLAEALGYRHYADTTFVRPDDGWSETLAILSRFALAEAEPIDLRPSVPNCLRARLDTPAGPVDVYNTHLHPRDSDLRQREVALILERMSREPEVRAILCGDFNAVPEGRTMALAWPHLRSAYELARGSHPDSTFPTPLRPVAGRTPRFSERREAPPADDESEAKAAIDYILVRPSQLQALEARVIGAEPVDGVWPSDHYGVLVRLATLG